MLIYRITSQFSNLARDYFYDDMAKFGHASDEEILVAQDRVGLIIGELFKAGKLKDWNTKYAA